MQTTTHMETRPILWGLLRLPVHPIYERDMRFGGNISHDLPRTLRRAIFFVFCAFLVSVTFITVISLFFTGTPRLAEAIFGAFYATVMFVFPVLALAFGQMLNVIALASSVNIITEEASAHRWDLLRLAAGDEQRLLTAKLGLARARAWRVTAMCLVLQPFKLALLVPTTFYSIVETPFRQAVPANWFFPWLIVLLMVFPAFMLGPIWRMKLLTAMGLAISARTTDQTMGTLAAVGVALGFVLAQLTLVFGALSLATTLSTLVIPAEADFRWRMLVYWPLVLTTLSWLPFFVYGGLQRAFERMAANRIERGA